MKHTRRLLSMLLVLVFTLSFVSTGVIAWASEEDGGGR